MIIILFIATIACALGVWVSANNVTGFLVKIEATFVFIGKPCVFQGLNGCQSGIWIDFKTFFDEIDKQFSILSFIILFNRHTNRP